MEESGLVDWSRTREALKTLISLFTCTTCGNTLQEPCSFQMCDHYFCKSCAMNLINCGTNCPACDAVLWREHLQTNLKIPEVMKMCEQIRGLICKDEQSKEQGQNIGIDNSDECNTYVFQYPESTEESCNIANKNTEHILGDKVIVIEIEDDSENVEGEENLNLVPDNVIKSPECSVTFAEPLSEITFVKGKTDESNSNFVDKDVESHFDEKSINNGITCNKDKEEEILALPLPLTNESNEENINVGDGSDNDNDNSDDIKNAFDNIDGGDQSESIQHEDKEVDVDVDFNVIKGKSMLAVGDDFQSNADNQDVSLTSIKSKGKRKGRLCNIVADKEDEPSSQSPEKSQFSEAISDYDCAQGIQRNPKSLMKKPKFTYGKKRKEGSILKHNATIPLLVTNRSSNFTEERSVFDFSSGTITKSISFGNKNDISNEENIEGTASDRSICSKRKRGEQSMSKAPVKKTVGKGKKSTEVTNSKENKENDNKQKETGQGKTQKPKARNLDKRNKKGETALHTACIKGNYERAKELLELGAQSNTKDFNGWTPIHEASNHGFTNIVELLLDYNAIIDCVAGEDNDTPLHDAVSNNRVEVSRLLLQRGAPTNIKNRVGLFPNGYAYTSEMKKVFKEVNMFETKETSNNQLNTSSASLGAPYVFITTNLKSLESIEVKKCCDLIGGKLSSEFDLSVTHVICGTDENVISVSRTMKYLLGVLTGKWLVSFKWITESLKKRKWELEADYEVKGSPGAFEEIPQKSRINNFKCLPKLFEGCSFYLSGMFDNSLSKETVINLIKIGGGKILYREPKTSNLDPSISPLSPKISKLNLVSKVAAPLVIYHAKQNSAQLCCKEYIIYDATGNPGHKKVCSPVLCTAPVAWLLDCISNFQILDVQDSYEQKDGYKSSQN